MKSLNDHKTTNLSDRVYQEYRELAGRYDRQWRSYLNHTQQKASELLLPEYNDKILDSSGGTGLFATYLLKKPETSVVISDFSDEMLEQARQRFNSQRDRVTIVRADAHKLPFSDGAFHKVYNLNSLHYYANQDFAVDELVRVCRPGGKLLILDWSSDTRLFRMFARIMRMAGYEYSRILSSDELRNMFRERGLHIIQSENWTWRGWSLAAVVAEKPIG